MASLLSQLDTQPRVRSFLERAVAQNRASHAYLFLGAPGSGKLDAAWALAQALLCGDHGCGACDDCIRVARHTHPDVHLYQPESATGYLISQTRTLLEEVALAPIRGSRKVYILTRAEQLRANTANALLKTLEEPPEGVTFILLGTSSEAILPTIVSRCQCVPFRTISPERAAEAVHRATGVPLERCRMAVAVAGSPARATEFLKSGAHQGMRSAMIRAIDSLVYADEADILQIAPNDLGAAIEVLTGTNPLATWKKREKKQDGKGKGKKFDKPASEQSEMDRFIEENADYLSRGAIKQLEERAKRELTARNRSAIIEMLASARSLLRDVLICLEGMPDEVVNVDATETIDRLAAKASSAGVLDALDAVSAAEMRLRRNVTPQLAIEVMLFDIRKALTCP